MVMPPRMYNELSIGGPDCIELPMVNFKSFLFTSKVLPKRYFPTILSPESGSKSQPFFVRSYGYFSPSFSVVGIRSLP